MKPVLLAGALCCLLLSSCAANPSRSYNTDWDTFQGSAQRIGAVPDAPRPPLQQKWTFETGGRLVYPPVVREGIAYLGSRDSRLYAVRLDDGGKVWDIDLPLGGLFSSPTLAGEQIYGGKWTPYYAVHAWDRLSGAELWSRETGELVNRPPWVLVTADTLFTHRDPAVGQEEQFKVVAEAWELAGQQTQWQTPLQGIPAVAPALSPELILYATDNDRLIALERSSGELRWQAELASEPVSTPLLHGQHAIVATATGFVYAFELETGKVAWRYQFPNATLSADLALSGELLLIPAGKQLLTFNTRTLEAGWRFRAPNELTAPIASRDFVYIGSLNQMLYVLESTRGTVAGMYRVGGEILAAPVAVDGLVLVASTDGKLYAFEEKEVVQAPVQPQQPPPQRRRPSRW